MSVEKSGKIVCDTCGLPIDNPGMAMVVWDVRTDGTQSREMKRETPHPVYIVHKGRCDRWRSGVASSWFELRDFLNPEGFARWVNDRLRELLPEETPLVQLIDGMWPLVLRGTTPEEHRVCRHLLEAGLWYGRPLTRTKGQRGRRKDSQG
jgi:hypothetical protein